jgi:hypothetical protein
MATNEYSFVSKWLVTGRAADVYGILINGSDYPRWWPQVYLSVEETSSGGEHGLGRSGRLHTKGWLPYTLRWSMVVTGVDYPHGFSLAASGDFNGTGVWRFDQRADQVAIRFDWNIRADKPLLRYLSFLFKPLFRANHHWAMACGEKALRAELVRQTGSDGSV